MPAIEIRDLTVEYETGTTASRPIEDLDHDIHDGCLTLLLGPSGCGKTTLLSCLGGLLRPRSGRIVCDGTDLAAASEEELRLHRQDRVGIVFQGFNLIASLSALDNVAAPLIAQGVHRRSARTRADAALGEVGMQEHARSRPGHLSGGQQQRVAIARGIVHDPRIVLADEPTANLDFVQTEAVVSVLRGLARTGRAVVVSTHDDRLLPVADAVIDLTPRLDEQRPPTEPLRLAAGDVVFAQGDRGSLVYVVESGSIAIVRRSETGVEHLAACGPGNYFGELGPMLGQPRSASAVAGTDAVVRAMTLQEFRALGRDAAWRATS